MIIEGFSTLILSYNTMNHQNAFFSVIVTLQFTLDRLPKTSLLSMAITIKHHRVQT